MSKTLPKPSHVVDIVLDSRETHIRKELESLSIDFRSEQLAIGDVLFKQANTDTTLLICERKTHSDLYSSIINRRFSEQRDRLKPCTETCKVVYILENYNSQLFASPLVKTPSKPDKTKVVSGALENLILFYNMYILPTHSVKHTAQVLCSIKSKLEKQLTETGSVHSDGTTFAQRKHKIMDNIFHHQLLLISGVSPDIATAIRKHYPTVNNLCKSYNSLTTVEQREKMLENIPLEKRRLGKVLSKRIHDVYMS
jgi:ERCC4-type nuclease